MSKLTDVALAFVEMAHKIVWCTAATVDATGPTPLKRAPVGADAGAGFATG